MRGRAVAIIAARPWRPAVSRDRCVALMRWAGRGYSGACAVDQVGWRRPPFRSPRAPTPHRRQAASGRPPATSATPDREKAHAVRPVHDALRLRRRRRDAGGPAREPARAGRPGGRARVRRRVDGGASLRPLRPRRPAESDPGRRGSRGADHEDPDRPDGQHRRVVAPDPVGRGPGHPRQPEPREGRRRLRPGRVALRGAAVPSARGPAERPGESRALSRDRGDRPEGLERGAIRARGPELHLSCSRHPLCTPPLSRGPGVAGR